MNSPALVCANPDCRVAQDGKCVEGHALEQCSFFGKTEIVSLHVVGRDEEQPEAGEQWIELHPGLSLPTELASGVLGGYASRVVGVIGPHESGKTSLIAGLYELFQMGPISDVKFAGTDCLHAFESICHDARAASRRDVAYTPRTNRGEVRFYHLNVALSPSRERIALLLGDRAGEEYAQVADEIALTEPLFELRRASTITLLVDGKKLADLKQRHSVQGDLIGIARALVEGGVFDHHPRLAIVLTKLDDVQASSDRERIMKDFLRIVEAVKTIPGSRTSLVQSFLTAASPKTAGVARGTGLAELLKFWLIAPESGLVEITPVASGRAFDHLKEREEA